MKNMSRGGTLRPLRLLVESLPAVTDHRTC